MSEPNPKKPRLNNKLHINNYANDELSDSTEGNRNSVNNGSLTGSNNVNLTRSNNRNINVNLTRSNHRNRNAANNSHNSNWSNVRNNHFRNKTISKKTVHKTKKYNENGYNANYESNEELDEEDIVNEIRAEMVADNLLQNNVPGCCELTMEERLEIIKNEISHVDETYNELMTKISKKTFVNMVSSNLPPENVPNSLQKWKEEASKRASIFQQTKESNIENAFKYLLPWFDPNKKFHVMENSKAPTSMHKMIKGYAYKIACALFTRANVTTAVNDCMEYDNPTYKYLNNLLFVMQCGSRIINHYLDEHWTEFVTVPIKQGGIVSKYVHSGGNLIVIIAGMLCYLYEKRKNPINMKNNDLLEQIREEFHSKLGHNKNSFYVWLNNAMKDPEFKVMLGNCTSNISDLDFIFMAPDNLVDTIDNQYLAEVNALSAYVIRKILITAHSDDTDEETKQAQVILPFQNSFDDRWPKFRFFGMSGMEKKDTDKMKKLQEDKVKELMQQEMTTKPFISKQLMKKWTKDIKVTVEKKVSYYGYRQTSNRIDEVPMYLNRLKQGYQPFYDMAPDMSESLMKEYGSKLGECIDLSIGAREMSRKMKNNKNNKNISLGGAAAEHQGNVYQFKQEKYKKGKYYSLETVIHDLNYTLSKARDDKSEKRQMRLSFLTRIPPKYGNALFGILASKIT